MDSTINSKWTAKYWTERSAKVDGPEILNWFKVQKLNVPLFNFWPSTLQLLHCPLCNVWPCTFTLQFIQIVHFPSPGPSNCRQLFNCRQFWLKRPSTFENHQIILIWFYLDVFRFSAKKTLEVTNILSWCRLVLCYQLISIDWSSLTRIKNSIYIFDYMIWWASNETEH